MSSPFMTIEEFNSAADGPTEGAIYTFANSPAINAIALIVAAGLFIWFIVATYTTHAEQPAVDKSLERLSSFIVIGLLSLVAADYRQSARPNPVTRSTAQAQAVDQTAIDRTNGLPSAVPPRGAASLGLLGMIGIGLPGDARRAKAQAKNRERRRRKRLANRSNQHLR